MKYKQNMNTRNRKIIFVIAVMIWMVLIFSFSTRSGDLSQTDSYEVGMIVGNIFVPGYSSWTETKQLEFAQKVDHPIRKTAHATEYAILGMLIVGAYADTKNSKKKNLLIPWMIATGYAATDEFHQLFVPGRSGQLKDVLIDSSGAMVGVIFTLLVYGVIVKKRNSHA